MPVVEKSEGGRVYVRPVGQEFTVGDRASVSDEAAKYLVEERGDFDIVDKDDAEGAAGYLRDEPPAVQIEEGVCPWCPPDDRYEGDNVGQHASAAHPDEWDNYKED